MEHTTSGRKLEKYRVFPIIAWLTFVVFVLFVYGITVELRQSTENLRESTTRLEAAAKNLDQVEDFEI